MYELPNFFKFWFEIALNGFLDKFLTWFSLHLPKEVLNALLKIQITIGTNFWNILYYLSYLVIYWAILGD